MLVIDVFKKIEKNLLLLLDLKIALSKKYKAKKYELVMSSQKTKKERKNVYQA